MLNEKIDDILADLVDTDTEWQNYLQTLHSLMPGATFEIWKRDSGRVAIKPYLELSAKVEKALNAKKIESLPALLGTVEEVPLYGVQTPNKGVYLLALIPEDITGTDQPAIVAKLLQSAIDSANQMLEMQDLELENQQLFRQIEALKSQHTKLLEDNYSQYLLIQEKEKEYSRKLEKEIARKTSKLRDANERLKEASRLKSEFLANMSHELRTPMNAIIGFSDLLGETNLDRDQKDYVKTICNASESLLILINGILDLAKIEAGKMEVENKPFDLHRLIKDVVALFKVSTRGKNVALNCLVDDSMPMKLVGDPNRLRQVLVNLVGNAMKFTAMGRVEVHAHVVKKTKQKCWVAFTVLDTGIGIPAERQKAIFDKFIQADGSTTRRYGGSGLGLAISQQLVKLMGGSIELKSVPGEGSVFKFKLPFTIETLVEDVEAEKGQRKEDICAKISSLKVALEVLLVEDNPVNQKLAGILLRRQGCKVMIANDGEEALDFIKKHRFDLVLMDIQMPNLDGIAATKMIRKLERNKDKAKDFKSLAGRKKPITIVGLTAHARKEDEEECIAAGMNDFLTKPINKEALHTILHKEMSLIKNKS